MLTRRLYYRAYFVTLHRMLEPEYPFFSPLYIMAKPAGPACNLACKYCYYLEKKKLLDAEGTCRMSDEVLRLYIESYCAAQTGPYVNFTWHGGEAMLRNLDFYRKALGYQQQYAAGRTVVNCLQTNGTLLNDQWCAFLRRHNWLVGISIDGPEEIHDAYRRDPAGKGSFQRTIRGIRLLQRHGVEWNAMAVVNALNVTDPDGFYNFFRQLGCRFLQFTPIVERKDPDGMLTDPFTPGEVSPESVSPQQWGDFLCRVFDLWRRHDVGRLFVQLFDATLANWVGHDPGLCTLGKLCGHAGVIEHNGDVYSCDHFVFPKYRLGNIRRMSVEQMMLSEQQRRFAAMKIASLPQQCRDCRWSFACNGECPKNRFAVTADGQPGLNYLCEGYSRFFSHAAPYMDFMAAELKAHRPPANVMGFEPQK